MPAQYKVEQVAELTGLFDGAEAIFMAEYRGLTVAQTSAFRKVVRDAGGFVKVARNTLVNIALENLGLAKADELLTGPNVFVVAPTESPAVAKAVKEFGEKKEHKAFILKGGIMGTSLLDAKAVEALASLPSRDQLLAQVVGTIAAPLRGLVTVLSGPARELVTCLSQLAEKKDAA